MLRSTILRPLLATAALSIILPALQAQTVPCSCKDILLNNPGMGTGLYTIDPDGSGPVTPIRVFCDMNINGGGWTVLFNSSNPALWGTNSGTAGAGDWSHDLKFLGFMTGEVAIIRTDTWQFEQVDGIAGADLLKCAPGKNGRSWNGSKSNSNQAVHLGIHTSTFKQNTGYVTVSDTCISNTSGWGFGHRALINDKQGFGWDSQDFGPTSFRIAFREEGSCQCAAPGQANRTGATLLANNTGATGGGPFEVKVVPQQKLTLDWTGQANASIILFWAPKSCSNSLNLGCTGLVDLDILSGISVLFQNPLFALDQSGKASQTFSIPNLAPGLIMSMQGMVQSNGCASGFMLTAAFDIKI